MNPFTFNEPLIRVLPKEDLDVPLIQYEILSDSRVEFEDGRVFDKNARRWLLPFDRCRVHLKHGDVFWHCYLVQMVSNTIYAGMAGNALAIFCSPKCLPEKVYVQEFWLCKPAENEPQIMDGLAIRERLSCINNDKSVSELSKSGEAYNYIIKTMRHFVKSLCADFSNPHLFLCKKAPATPQGKTVSWQRKREHFVFLHKSHSANRKESIGRKCIEDGSIIDRAAHSRRAHFRLLSSPKFKHKQGQRVWVRSAWCGPKEWKDRSGQIYKIVEKPADAFNPKAVR